MKYVFDKGFVEVYEAWTGAGIRSAMARLLDDRSSGSASPQGRLPRDPAARIVVKPNLNNDLVALTGNSVDLRVLDALLRGLLERGYTHVTVADGPNVGMDRRGIDGFRRLRVDRLCQALGVRLVNVNRDPGTPVPLHAGVAPRVGRVIQEKDFLISVPRIKTHAEATLSCACKNWVGICSGQDKRLVHHDLPRNILALNEAIRPDLIVVDGIVGMEGNGPGDGDPFRLGLLLASDDAFVTDLAVCRMMDLDWRDVPYLALARDAGHIGESLARQVADRVPVVRPIRRAPPRSRLARLSEARTLLWLKRAVRPVVARPAVARLAYRMRIIQDVYDLRDDTLRVMGRDAGACTRCGRCVDFCPAALSFEQIGSLPEPEACLQCLYCWFVCPTGAIRVEGEPRHLERQIARYRKPLSTL